MLFVIRTYRLFLERSLCSLPFTPSYRMQTESSDTEQLRTISQHTQHTSHEKPLIDDTHTHTFDSRKQSNTYKPRATWLLVCCCYREMPPPPPPAAHRRRRRRLLLSRSPDRHAARSARTRTHKPLVRFIACRSKLAVGSAQAFRHHPLPPLHPSSSRLVQRLRRCSHNTTTNTISLCIRICCVVSHRRRRRCQPTAVIAVFSPWQPTRMANRRAMRNSKSSSRWTI